MRLRISTRGIEAIAELDLVGAAEAVKALSRRLPLSGELVQSAWSGHACEVVLPDAELAQGARSMNELPRGALAIGRTAEASVLLIAYGPTLHHTAAGRAPTTWIGRITEDGGPLLAQLESTFDDGALAVTIRAEE